MTDRPSPKDLLNSTGAWYLRVSLDEVAQDVTSQRENVKRWLGNHGLNVKKIHQYEDAEGYTPRHSPETRPKFQKLMEAVRAGLVKWVIVDHQNRIGGKDEWHYASLIHEFRTHHCQVWTIRGEHLSGDDALSFFQGGLTAGASKQELISKAQGVLRGQKQKAKAGEWHGGYVPYGLDVVCLDRQTNEEKWRIRWYGHFVRKKIFPNGREEEYNGKGNLPAIEDLKEKLVLQPGPPDRIEVVKEIFEAFATQSISTYQIAKKLNQTGVKPTYNDTWLGSHIVTILDNFAYIGLPAWNKQGGGEYLEDDGVEVKPVTMSKGRRERPRSAWVFPDKPVFDPIIPKNIWDKVREKRDKRDRQKRAPKNSAIWLAGLVHCAQCGKRMRGQKRPNYVQFLCQTGDKKKFGKKDITCLRNTVHHELIEKVVEQYLTDIGEAVDTLIEANRTGDFGLLDSLQEEFNSTLHQSSLHGTEMFIFIFENGGWDELSKHLKNGGIPKLKDDFFPKFIEIYRKTYAASKAEKEKELRNLEKKHDQLMTVIERFKGAPRALEKKQTEILEVETAIDKVEKQLTDLSEIALQHRAQLDDLRDAIAKAKKTKGKDSGLRAKAEAVRRLIDRIDVEFEPTGKSYPQSVPIFIDVIPVEGSKVRYAVAD